MHGHNSTASAKDRAAPVVALVGNPNVGKSAIFSLLTGRYAIVSNYPGTTVEVTSGWARIGGTRVELIDTPGVNSLIPRSEDEEVTRSILLDRHPRAVLQVIDAKNLRRGLLITTQLAEMGLPIVMALNLWDEAVERGIAIDTGRLSRMLGVPVVQTIATQKLGIDTLAEAVANAAVPSIAIDYGPAIEAAVANVGADGVRPAIPIARHTAVCPCMDYRGAALMLLAGDPALEHRMHPAEWPELGLHRKAVEAKLGEPASYAIGRRRAAYVDTILAQVTEVERPAESSRLARRLFFYAIGPLLGLGVSYVTASLLLGAVGRFIALGGAVQPATWSASLLGGVAYTLHFLRERTRARSVSTVLGNVAMHRVLAFPVLAAVLWAVYLVVGVVGAGQCVDFLENVVFGTSLHPSGGFSVLGLHVAFGGVNYYLAWLAGRVLPRDGIVFQLLFAEDAGLIRVGLTYAIAIVLPIVGFFFLMFGVMEDSGYLPRLAVMMDWLFKKIGLNGKAVLPIVLGFGCGTMATLTTRILETRRERIIATLLLALAIPCSAQLGIIAGVLADIGGGGAFALYVGVIASQFLFIGWLASKAIKGRNSDFMLEIPPFRVPQLANIVVKTFHRVIWFVKEAVPLFLIGTLALFILTRIGYNEVSRPLGLLSYADRIGAPVTVRLLGLPAQPAEPQSAAAAQPGVGSRVRHSSTQAFILGFLRRDYGAVSIRENFKGRFFSARQAMVTLIVITLFVPCLANLLVIIKERGPATAALIVGFIIPYAFLVGAALNWVLAATGAM